MACEICGKDDLFSDVTGGRACSICVMRLLGGNAQPTPEQIAGIRTALGLKKGEMFQQDHAEQARKILGR